MFLQRTRLAKCVPGGREKSVLTTLERWECDRAALAAGDQQAQAARTSWQTWPRSKSCVVRTSRDRLRSTTRGEGVVRARAKSQTRGRCGRTQGVWEADCGQWQSYWDRQGPGSGRNKVWKGSGPDTSSQLGVREREKALRATAGTLSLLSAATRRLRCGPTPAFCLSVCLLEERRCGPDDPDPLISLLDAFL